MFTCCSIVKEETRSASPHCPKPNESKEPEGTAVEENTNGRSTLFTVHGGRPACASPCSLQSDFSNLHFTEKSMHGEIVITKEMEEEEKHLVEEGEKKEREMMEEARQSWEKDSQEMRFRRLQHLLEKSNIYSKFLLTKMEQQQQDERIKKERLEKKATNQKQKVSVLLYHGPQKERMDLVKKIRQAQGPLRMCPVVVTSFEIAMRDRKLLQRFHWNYMIVDEGHRIKNLNCRLVQELKMLMTDNKLLLTGTPLQNNLSELWSLLNFLLPDVFDDLKSFESWFDISTITSDAENIVANEREQNILHMLHQDDSAPVPLTSSGRPKRRARKVVDYYESNTDSVKDLEKYLEKVQKEMDSQASPVVDVSMPVDAQVNLKLQNILMLLKRCCNHAYLIEYPLDPTTGEFKIDEQLVETSGKFLILDRMLPELKKRGHKVLIFSQMTSILDILMDYCYLRGYDYSRLDGSMSYTDRDENMKKFSSDPEVFLFLLSTRAGGLGINLTAADTVIIFDSDWNPQADLQAQDRCHRIGQTKPVMVYRLITANTIDEKILERASAKRKLEKMVIHKNKFKGSKAELKQTKSCVDLNELVELLKSRDYDQAVKGTKGKVISDKDLEILLDRSDLMNQAKKRVKLEKDGVFKVMETKDDDGDISLS
uniref:Helicase, lymphoid specific n=1 Tax=Cyprinus carpio carpio TaxID=630221 RepID=A0A9J8B4X2_CYPCA